MFLKINNFLIVIILLLIFKKQFAISQGSYEESDVDSDEVIGKTIPKSFLTGEDPAEEEEAGPNDQPPGAPGLNQAAPAPDDQSNDQPPDTPANEQGSDQSESNDQKDESNVPAYKSQPDP